jgi:hypothetical protein
MNDQRPSTPPPLICVNDRVLLHYAVLTNSVQFNAGHGLFFVAGKEIGPVPWFLVWPSFRKKNPQRSRFITATAIGAQSELLVTNLSRLPREEQSESIPVRPPVGSKRTLMRKT